MSDILNKIVADKQIEVSQRKRLCPPSQLAKMLPAAERGNLAARSFARALAIEGTKIIAEIKRRSPSAGELAADLDIERTVKSYARHAQAISVVTDEKYFGGSLSMISAIKNLAPLPVLVKDFIFDEYQVQEARAA